MGMNENSSKILGDNNKQVRGQRISLQTPLKGEIHQEGCPLIKNEKETELKHALIQAIQIVKNFLNSKDVIHRGATSNKTTLFFTNQTIQDRF